MKLLKNINRNDYIDYNIVSNLPLLMKKIYNKILIIYQCYPSISDNVGKNLNRVYNNEFQLYIWVGFHHVKFIIETWNKTNINAY